MRNNILNFISLLFLLELSFSSCQQDVYIDLPAYTSKPVVYCLLKADTFPALYLSRSVSMYEPQDYSKLGIDSVLVKLTTNSGVDTLLRHKDTPKGVYFSIKQRIHVDSAYIITINYPTTDGQNISSVTRVPDYSPLDSIRVKKIEGENSDSLFVPYLYFTPRINTSYYSVHYYLKKGKKTETQEEENSSKVKLPKYEPFQDGIPFKFVNVEPQSRLYIMRKAFEKGDTADILFRNINYEYYNFLRTATQNSESGEPVLIISNIHGGLGIFGAFTEDRRQIVFK